MALLFASNPSGYASQSGVFHVQLAPPAKSRKSGDPRWEARIDRIDQATGKVVSRLHGHTLQSACRLITREEQE